MSQADHEAPGGPGEDAKPFHVEEPAESADESPREVNEDQGDDAASGG